jgi:hypothetical protein
MGIYTMVVILGTVIIVSLISRAFGGSKDGECFRQRDESKDMEKCIKANLER